MVYQSGSVFAGYTIDRVLGTGGMGTVYLAHHPRLPRKDALKLLRADLSSEPGFRTRFEREADLAARLDHRNIVTVYDRGRTDEQLWIDMQYVEGIDASQSLLSEPQSMTVERVVRIVREVGRGLDYAHRHGLWHRDVKPANILLATHDDPDEPERVLLTDFGVAKAVDEVRQLTSTGNMLATLAYAAPEQIEARVLDHRVDIYALGCVLYELLTGSVPFPEPTAYATMAAHLMKAPPRPTATMPALPSALDDVVARAMAKNRDDRFTSCRDLARAASAAVVHKVADVRRPAGAASQPPARPPTRFQVPPVAMQASPQRPPGALSGPTPPTVLGPRPPYQLRVHRSGGGGLRQLPPVFTDRLTLLETAALLDLLDRAQFFRLPAHLAPEHALTGDVRQEITVISAQRTHTVSYDLSGSRRPDELDVLVGRLERLVGGWPPVASVSEPTPNVTPLAGPAGSTSEPTGQIGRPGFSRHPTPPALTGDGSTRPDDVIPYAGRSGLALASGEAKPHPPTRPWWRRSVFVAIAAAAVVAAATATTFVVAGGGQPLATPTSVQAVPEGDSVELRWAEVDQASQYQVLRDGGVVETTTDTTFVDSDVEPGQEYGYAVIALGRDGTHSEASDTRTVTLPEALAAPTGLVAAAQDGVVTLTWNKVDGASSYNLFRGLVLIDSGPDTRHVDTDAPLGSNGYSVEASGRDGGLSQPSMPAELTLAEDWGALAPTVEAFFALSFAEPLLPADPAEPGYQMARCGAGAVADDVHTDGVIVCNTPEGIHIEVLSYSDTEALQAREEEIAESSAPETWPRDDGTPAGALYKSPVGADTWRWSTWFDETLTQFALYVLWEGHTDGELYDAWWHYAPF